MTDNQTILEQMQTAVTEINCAHPDTVITELQAVLERIGPDSPDAEVIQRAIDRLEEIAEEMARIERDLSNNREYFFGMLEEV